MDSHFDRAGLPCFLWLLPLRPHGLHCVGCDGLVAPSMAVVEGQFGDVFLQCEVLLPSCQADLLWSRVLKNRCFRFSMISKRTFFLRRIIILFTVFLCASIIEDACMVEAGAVMRIQFWEASQVSGNRRPFGIATSLWCCNGGCYPFSLKGFLGS